MTVLNLLVGSGFCLAALIFRRTRPLALLAVVTAVLWFLGDVVGFLVFAHRGPLTHLLLIYPDTKLHRRTHRIIVSACYVLSSAYPLGRLDLATIALAVWIIVVSLWRPAKVSSGCAGRRPRRSFAGSWSANRGQQRVDR